MPLWVLMNNVPGERLLNVLRNQDLRGFEPSEYGQIARKFSLDIRYQKNLAGQLMANATIKRQSRQLNVGRVA